MMNYINKLPQSLKGESIYLEQMLDMKNFSTSYKMLWIYGIYKEIIKGKTTIPIKRIISKMVAITWYPVIYYNLSLGVQDRLSNIVYYLHDHLKVDRESKEEYISDFIFNSDDKELNKMVNNISLYVPYRLIRPLYDKELKIKEEILGRKISDSEINNFILELSNIDKNPFYKIDKKNKVITIGESWFEYITNNQAIIEGWINYKFICYLQLRNPNVPAIPFKIYPPMKRDLTKAKNFWRIIGAQHPIVDIYTKKLFSESNFDTYGGVSIDHFIPWSFVLHDELWNLVPTFKNVNSSKGNNLPSLEEYFNNFCELQFTAFSIAKGNKKIPQKYLEDYFNVNRHFYDINITESKSKEVFINSIKKIILPLHQIASNQGYGNWSCNIK